MEKCHSVNLTGSMLFGSIRFNHFLLIKASDGSKIRNYPYEIQFKVNLYPLSFFANTPFIFLFCNCYIRTLNSFLYLYVIYLHFTFTFMLAKAGQTAGPNWLTLFEGTHGYWVFFLYKTRFFSKFKNILLHGKRRALFM